MWGLGVGVVGGLEGDRGNSGERGIGEYFNVFLPHADKEINADRLSDLPQVIQGSETTAA